MEQYGRNNANHLFELQTAATDRSKCIVGFESQHTSNQMPATTLATTTEFLFPGGLRHMRSEQVSHNNTCNNPCWRGAVGCPWALVRTMHQGNSRMPMISMMAYIVMSCRHYCRELPAPNSCAEVRLEITNCFIAAIIVGCVVYMVDDVRFVCCEFRIR